MAWGKAVVAKLLGRIEELERKCEQRPTADIEKKGTAGTNGDTMNVGVRATCEDEEQK